MTVILNILWSFLSILIYCNSTDFLIWNVNHLHYQNINWFYAWTCRMVLSIECVYTINKDATITNYRILYFTTKFSWSSNVTLIELFLLVLDCNKWMWIEKPKTNLDHTQNKKKLKLCDNIVFATMVEDWNNAFQENIFRR